MSKSDCALLNLAYAISRLLPRGKGEVPRLMGRVGRRWIDHSVKTRHGALLPIIPEALDVFVSFLRESNSVDYWVFRVVNAMLEKGGVCYDIGANVGYIAVETAHLREKDGIEVFAFEPQPHLSANIEKAAQVNNLQNMHVFNAAIGDSKGRIGFKEMRHCVHGMVSKSEEKPSYYVPLEMIDDLVASGRIPPPDVIKIDVEGFEYAVIQGGFETIRRNSPVVVFELTHGTSDFGFSPKMLAELFDGVGVGYSFFNVAGQSFDLENYEIVATKNIDVVAVPRCRMERFKWFKYEFDRGGIDGRWSFRVDGETNE